MLLSDISLSQKLERTEARANADFVETRARLGPDHGAEWIEVGGAYAMYDGAESPLTQTFGLGIFEEATADHLDEIESFFNAHNSPVFHEISPLANPSILTLLGERGYRPIELTSVMYRTLGDLVETPPTRKTDVVTRTVTAGEVAVWARTSADAWVTEHPELAHFMYDFGSVSAQCEGAFPYLAELDGLPVATGMLFVYEDVCILAGASTIPEWRNRGAQNALLSARLKFAAERNCNLAIMGASPGSQSQINAQKNGFKIAYTRTKWQLVR